MAGRMAGSSAFEAVAMIAAGWDALFESDVYALSTTELTAMLQEVEVQRRRGESLDQTLIAQVVERGTAGEYARTSPVDLLVELLRITPREAKSRVDRARDLGPRRALTGEALGPILPKVSAAMRSGEISAEHASVIVRAVDNIPDRFAGRFDGIVEHGLVEYARQTHPGEVAKAGQVLLQRIDQDGEQPREEERQRRRDYGIRMGADGTGSPYGRFTPALCAVWNPILDALSAPIPADETGERDDRTAGQRRHDAMLEAGLRLLRSSTLPDSGGVPVTVLAHVDADDLATQLAEHLDQEVDGSECPIADEARRSADELASLSATRGQRRADKQARAGVAVTGHGGLLPIDELLRLAGEAQLVSVVTSATGGVLSYGHTRRLASCGQRQALAARDRGCSFPGCTRPPAWCQAHHVIPWLVGGPTDLDNLCLLCSFHHREFEKRGWTVVMRGGVPEWIPPPWLDPDQVPRQNTAHHIAEFDFEFRDTG